MINAEHVPPHDVEFVRDGRTMVDRMGGVFEDSKRLKGIRTAAAQRGAGPFVFEYGPERAGGKKDMVFTCPVSVVPGWAWELFDLWWQSRMLGALPLSGGVLDQPVVVRRAFPVFEAEHRAVEERSGREAAAYGTATAIARVFSGGGRK